MKTLLLEIALLLIVLVLWLVEKTRNYRILGVLYWMAALAALVLGAIAAIKFL